MPVRKRRPGRPRGSKNKLRPVEAGTAPSDVAIARAVAIATEHLHPKELFVNAWLTYSAVQHIDESLVPEKSRQRLHKRRVECRDAFSRAAAHFASYLVATRRTAGGPNAQT